MEGIEPSSMDFQSTALPTKLHLRQQRNARGERWDLNPYFYGHNIRFFQLNYFRHETLPDWNRTNNLLLIKQTLCLLSYRQDKKSQLFR